MARERHKGFSNGLVGDGIHDGPLDASGTVVPGLVLSGGKRCYHQEQACYSHWRTSFSASRARAAKISLGRTVSSAPSVSSISVPRSPS